MKLYEILLPDSAVDYEIIHIGCCVELNSQKVVLNAILSGDFGSTGTCQCLG